LLSSRKGSLTIFRSGNGNNRNANSFSIVFVVAQCEQPEPGQDAGGIFHFSNDGTNECRREEQWRFFRLRQSFRLLHEGARYSFEQLRRQK
jgi:hypothetical protein